MIPRLQRILAFICEHYVVTATQARNHVFAPHQDRDSRQTRRHLQELLRLKLVGKIQSEVVLPGSGLTCPAYFPLRLGTETLAAMTGDPRWYQSPTGAPAWQNLAHWAALTDLRVAIRRAVESQELAKLTAFYNEFDAVEDSADPARHYRTYTVIPPAQAEGKKIVAVPDACFELDVHGTRKAFFIELERGTNPVAKMCARKAPGYFYMDRLKLHKQIFPQAIDKFWVIAFAPSAHWRDRLRDTFKANGAAHVWRFCSITDVKPDASLLQSPIFYPCVGDPMPLLKGGA